MRKHFYIYIFAILMAGSVASCTAPRSVIHSGKVTPKGQFKAGFNMGGNIASEPLGQIDDITEAAVDAIVKKDTVFYDEQIDTFGKALIAYSLDPVGTTFDFYLRYGLAERMDVGYKYATGVHVFDAMYQFMGPTGTPENPGIGDWYGSIGIQYSGQKSDIVNKLFLDKLVPLLEFTAQRRATWSVLQEFANENGSALAGSFIVDFWYIPLIWLLLVGVMAWLYDRIKLQSPPRVSSWVYYPAHTAVMGLAVFLAIAGMRGGFAHSTRPITLSNAGEYVKRPNEMYLVLNTPFSMLRTIGKTNYSKVSYFDEQQLDSIYSPIHIPADAAVFQKKNVVIIVLESFGKEAMGGYNPNRLGKDGYQSFTPFLDQLMQDSKVYWHSFANGKKSIDALPAILTSIPSIQEPFVLTPYASNNLPSLPRTLNAEGYHTAFFHGAPNGSMGFKAFMNLIGVQEYYGKDEYNNDADFDGIWGIWDEEFLQFTAKKLNTFPEPFMGTVFTLSSHHPYKVPKRYEGKFKQGPLPLFQGINYTDMALQKFFEKASKMPWYNNTLFVITADHAGSPRHYPEYNTDWGAFAAPILFFAPGDEAFKGTEPRVVQQLDIMPTILGYLNYSKPYFSFGKNMLNTKGQQDFAVSYNAGVYQWIEDDLLLQFDGTRTIALYNYQHDIMLKQDLKDALPEKRQQMEARVKAFIQQYNNRMIDNKLQVE